MGTYGNSRSHIVLTAENGLYPVVAIPSIAIQDSVNGKFQDEVCMRERYTYDPLDPALRRPGDCRTGSTRCR